MAHNAVLAKVDTEVGRRVVHAIPAEAVRPAKLLVDEAIGIFGRYAVVRNRRAPRPRVQAQNTKPNQCCVLVFLVRKDSMTRRRLGKTSRVVIFRLFTLTDSPDSVFFFTVFFVAIAYVVVGRLTSPLPTPPRTAAAAIPRKGATQQGPAEPRLTPTR